MVSLHVLRVPTRPYGEEETGVPVNDVVAHEVEAVIGNKELGPTMQADQLEGNFDGKVPNCHVATLVAPPPEGAAAGVTQQHNAPLSDLGQAPGELVS